MNVVGIPAGVSVPDWLEALAQQLRKDLDGPGVKAVVFVLDVRRDSEMVRFFVTPNASRPTEFVGITHLGLDTYLHTADVPN